MGKSVEEATISLYIDTYLHAGSSADTDLRRAYLALTERNVRAKEKLVQGNTLFPIVQAYIGFAHQGYFRWVAKPIPIGSVDIIDSSTVAAVTRKHFDLLKNLYDIADSVISQEGKPLDSHDSNHILRCLDKLQRLITLREKYGQSAKEFSSADLMVAYGMLVQHDMALGLTGRRIPHEDVGALLTPSVLAPSENSSDIQDVIQRIADNTKYHVTNNYSFEWVKNKDKSAAFALPVLADETDITRERATQECLLKFLKGEEDCWFYFNYFTHHTHWGWDEKNQCPLLQFVSFADDQASVKLHREYTYRRTGSPVVNASEDMKGYYTQVALKLLFANDKKVSLFKSACNAIFSVKRITVELSNIKSEPFMIMTL